MTVLAKFPRTLEASHFPTADLVADQVPWSPLISQSTNLRPGAVRDVSGRKVVKVGLITLALNAACVLSVLGDQLSSDLEMTTIGVLVASSLGAIAVKMSPRRKGSGNLNSGSHRGDAGGRLHGKCGALDRDD